MGFFDFGSAKKKQDKELERMGYKAISLNAFQVAMHTNRVYGSARLKSIDKDRIRMELDQGLSQRQNGGPEQDGPEMGGMSM